MKCKLLFCLIFLFYTLSIFSEDKGNLRTEEHSFDQDGDGEKEVIVKVTYRGKQRILSERINKKNNEENFRIFDIDGKARVVESDYDGDGFYETLQIYGSDLNTFDFFFRKPSSTEVVPVGSTTLNKLLKKNEKFQAELREIVKKLSL